MAKKDDDFSAVLWPEYRVWEELKRRVSPC